LTGNFGGELYLSRRLDITVRQLVESAGEDRVRLLDRVLAETQRSLDHCARTYTFFPMGHMMLSPLPEEDGMRENLSYHMYLPVEPTDLDAVVQLPPAGAASATNEQ